MIDQDVAIARLGIANTQGIVMGRETRLLIGMAMAIAFVLPSVQAGAATKASAARLYTQAQAQHGALLYRQSCASCHAADLRGNIGPALVGTHFRQMASAQNLTAKSLLAVVSSSMPQTNPGALKPAQYDAIMAFILQRNGYPAGATKLSQNEAGLDSLKLAK